MLKQVSEQELKQKASELPIEVRAIFTDKDKNLSTIMGEIGDEHGLNEKETEKISDIVTHILFGYENREKLKDLVTEILNDNSKVISISSDIESKIIDTVSGSLKNINEKNEVMEEGGLSLKEAVEKSNTNDEITKEVEREDNKHSDEISEMKVPTKTIEEEDEVMIRPEGIPIKKENTIFEKKLSGFYKTPTDEIRSGELPTPKKIDDPYREQTE